MSDKTPKTEQSVGIPGRIDGITLKVIETELVSPRVVVDLEEIATNLLVEYPALCLDLRHVQEASSTAIGMVVRLHAVARKNGRAFCICFGLALEKLFTAVGITQIVDVVYLEG